MNKCWDQTLNTLIKRNLRDHKCMWLSTIYYHRCEPVIILRSFERLYRLYYVDKQRKVWNFLAGLSWRPQISMATVLDSPSPAAEASDWLDAAQPCKHSTGDRRERKVSSASIPFWLQETPANNGAQCWTFNSEIGYSGIDGVRLVFSHSKTSRMQITSIRTKVWVTSQLIFFLTP